MFHRRFCKQRFYGFRSEPVGRKSGHEINVLKMRPVSYNNSVLMCTWTASLFSKYTIQYTYIMYHYHIATRVWVPHKLNILLNHFNLIAIQNIFSQMAACLTNAQSILPFAANPLPNHAQPCRKDWAHVEGGWKESKQNWKVLKVHRESWRNIFIPLYSCIKSNQSWNWWNKLRYLSCCNDPYHSSLSVPNSDLLILHHDYIMIHLNLPDLPSNTAVSNLPTVAYPLFLVHRSIDSQSQLLKRGCSQQGKRLVMKSASPRSCNEN